MDSKGEKRGRPHETFVCFHFREAFGRVRWEDIESGEDHGYSDEGCVLS